MKLLNQLAVFLFYYTLCIVIISGTIALLVGYLKWDITAFTHLYDDTGGMTSNEAWRVYLLLISFPSALFGALQVFLIGEDLYLTSKDSHYE